mmetsp:Transcript_57597/g.66500  ORF Transcript_57597/g.66500 Transcript_57597/m.66500 type:complete len:477 (+) Transcript_57597:130-1560(+)
MNRQAFSYSDSWILPFVLGASASLSVVWISTNWENISTLLLPTLKSTRKESPSKSLTATGEKVFDHEELSHRMLRKAEAVIQLRTNRLIIVVERCTNDHNYSAILRTAEALGISTVYTIDPPDVVMEENENMLDQKQNKISRTQEEIKQRSLHHIFARNATEWITVRDFANSEDCVAFCRKQGYKLWVTDLSQEAEALNLYPNLMKPILPDKIALVFGTEAVGASNYILEQADRRIYLPLRGFADSLNLSVSTALVTQALFFLDPSLIGAMSEGERKYLRKTWFTKLAQQRILTPKQKKDRKQLASKIKKCEALKKRIEEDPNCHIQSGEQKKLDECSLYQHKLETIDALIDPIKVQTAVQEWIDNPPSPLTDLRRADCHRVCFVGKNTRDINKEYWKDMAATSNKGTIEGATAMEFRRKMGTVVEADNEQKSSPSLTTSITNNIEQKQSFDRISAIRSQFVSQRTESTTTIVDRN